MALPSAVSVGSLAFVVAAGAGLVAISTSSAQPEPAAGDTKTEQAASDRKRERAPTPTKSERTASRSTPATPTSSAKPPSPSPPVTTPVAPTQTLHKRKDPPPAQPDAVPNVLVEVYNNSGVTGLAAQQAAVLQSAGWSVAATDNWYGDIPANTVYYPPHLQAEAAQLAEVLGVQRLMPAVAPMQFDRLTVIFVTA